MPTTIFLILALASLSFDCAFAYDFNMLLLNSDGKFTIGSNISNETEITAWTGNKIGSYLKGNIIYSIDKNLVRAININNGQDFFKFDLINKVPANEMPWRICYSDNNKIFFCTYIVNEKNRSNNGVKYNIYAINIADANLAKLQIDDCYCEIFSAYDNIIFYSNKKGVICKYNYNDNSINETNITGLFPAVSPDGRFLICSVYGFLVKKLICINLNDNSSSVVTYLFNSDIHPIVRWSSDSRLIAFKKKSDLFLTQLYIADINEFKIIQEISNKSINGFFMNLKS